MSDANGLVIGVTELLRRPGTRRMVQRRVRLDALSSGANRVVDNEVDVDLALEASASSITAAGTVVARWQGECRRCLKEIDGVAEVEVHEVYERTPTEGETYQLTDDEIDLEEMVRDAVILALPLAPLCDQACAGPDPDAYPVTVATDDDEGESDSGGRRAKPSDPRWGALDQLHFD